MIFLGIYFTFTTFFAFYHDDAWMQWEKVIKILVMTLVTMILINDRTKLKYLIMVIAFSIGFLGLKGGIFSFATGGEFQVFGPEGSFFKDNNDMALALNMTLPMLFYLAKETEHPHLNKLLWFTFIMSIVSVLFTYSRGGALTLFAVGSLMLWKTRYKIFIVPALLILIVAGMAYMPEQWFGRMETIKTYEEDRSAMGRIYAWRTAWNVAVDRPIYGAGFEGLQGSTRFRYSPAPGATAGDVHSVYFEVLGEHGFVAFSLFAALILYTLSTLRTLKNRVKNEPRFIWAENYVQTCS